MKQKVTGFVFDLLHILVKDGIGQLIGFLDGQVPQGFEGLLSVPRTFFAQVVHDVQQPSKCLEMLFPCVHGPKVRVAVAAMTILKNAANQSSPKMLHF